MCNKLGLYPAVGPRTVAPGGSSPHGTLSKAVIPDRESNPRHNLPTYQGWVSDGLRDPSNTGHFVGSPRPGYCIYPDRLIWVFAYTRDVASKLSALESARSREFSAPELGSLASPEGREKSSDI